MTNKESLEYCLGIVTIDPSGQIPMEIVRLLYLQSLNLWCNQIEWKNSLKDW